MDIFLFLNVDLDAVKYFDCYPDGWNPDGVLKNLEEYSVSSIPIFGSVIMKIIYYELALWYKYPFESELCLERVPKFSGWFTVWIWILYDATNFIEPIKFQIYIKKIIWTMKTVVGSYIHQKSIYV